jgi:hypothetical protein
MNLLISFVLKSRKKSKKAKAILSLVTSIVIGSIAICLLANISTNINEAAAQGPYLKTRTVNVPPSTNATARTYCENGDGIISGGYSLEFQSINSPFNTMIYSNHPSQKINKTGYFEGWEVGLVNRGIEKAGVSATTLCLNLTLTP